MDAPSSLSALIAAGTEICRVTAADNAGLLGGLFLTGLVGSLTHCSGMCGPFVLSQLAARMEAIPAAGMRERDRFAAALLLPYHLGRATTYAALGAAAAAATGLVAGWSGFRWLAAGLLGVAALVLVGMALPGLKRMVAGGGEGWWGASVGRLARPLFATPTGWRGWLLGVALGFIPCGLLYAALAAAAATRTPLAGAFAMVAFAAGTVPMLVTVGAAGQLAVARFRAPLLRWAPLLLVANAGVLGMMAWRLLA